ncbi:GDP-Man:Man(3)GlcNAc(2)-PP-Dol alpha-1,2-mannosyltransferase-like isoform X2 [Mercenaria mercenaria]|uniref:GDP-Man:Man(3)GlcNAc(2)-PP-Dol alpha-1,2-mannosyltransferase-like isoform X2 n=1 Tax=Mercenaria mercenaria TaxID=6596 RepID=UPI00234E9D75|nr:GDP-Man:Man(3)GlcNAc(2)-PP-Dol alpha-1,2-mannosyltransferase-like isoform X2 [Mercenaria mercenaria]
MELAQIINEYLSFLSEMFWLLILICIFFIFVSFVLFTFIKYWIRNRAKTLLPQLRETSATREKTVVVGFFHPYCNAGGGGERVLWVAIRSLQNRYPNVKCLVYTGDFEASGEEILYKARQRFNITLPKPVEFVFLRSRNWVEARKYPIFTLLGQSLGSVVLGWEALMAYVPDIYIDSMGYAFTLPLFKYLGGSIVGCYVHYPTISTDMLQRVSDRETGFNNASIVTRSSFLTSIKLLYYRMFAYCYGLAGSRSDTVMVNSTWTYGHIKSLWGVGDKAVIVYPPCDISEFMKIDLTDKQNSHVQSILSVAQFRPEKNHRLQLEGFCKFLEKYSKKEKSKYKLILVGGCRDQKDSQRVEELRKLADELNIKDYVEFKLNVSFEDLKSMMAEATIGLHTMRDEHFGIGVVEMMAAGLVTLAHDSAGPKLDILTPYDGQSTGYLASDKETYADSMENIFNLSQKQSLDIRENARKSVTRFSESEFEQGFNSVVEPLLKLN